MTTDYPKILYDSRLDDGTLTASTTATGYAAANVTDWRPYTKWQPTAMPATLTVDCGSAKSADYWLIYGHDLFTKGATIQLRGSTNNFTTSDVLVDTFTPSSDDPFVRFISTATYRYWRLRVTGASAPTLAIASVGLLLDVPMYLSVGFDPLGRTPKGTYNRSEQGHPLGRVVRYEEWSEELRFQSLTWSWLRSTWIPAWEAHLRDDPFVFMWDPSGHPAEINLVAVDGGYKTPHSVGSYADLSFKVVGVAS